MKSGSPSHTTIAPAPLCEAGNDSILARLDHEHLLAHEKAIRLAEGLWAKARILKRQAQGMPVDEIMSEGGNLGRLAVSILADMLAKPADFAEPDSEPVEVRRLRLA
jgi:hypothetical protein